MSRTKKRPKQASWLRRLLVFGFKLTIVGAVILLGYLIYLDGSVTQRFSVERYQAPALVYGRSLTLVPQSTISRAEVVAELQRLKYEQTAQVTDSGQYRLTQHGLEFYRRPFDFADGPQMAQRVQVNFAGDRIQSIHSLPNGHPLERIRLEPPYIGRLAGGSEESRLLVGLERVPSLLIETLLLVEDRDFYHHWGISFTAIARAAITNLMAMRTVQGGSTLTQQLVKNLYLSREQTLWRKANEALMALVLDYRFSKNEILETYLNEVYFGQDLGSAVHGIGLASRLYFGKQVEELDAADIALLVGVIKGPSYYDPRRYPERAQQRRDLILQLMFNNDLISQTEYLRSVNQPIIPPGSGRLVTANLPHYMELVKYELGQLRLPDDWHHDGLRIFTYFDPAAQIAAEQAVQQQLPKISKDNEIQAAVVVANHQQAGIAAVVGDKNPRRVGFNRAVAAIRPIGSLIKPLIYAEALQSTGALELGSMVLDEPLSLPQPGQADWEPQNYDREFKGAMLVYDALIQSRNLPAVRVGLSVGVERISSVLQQSGVESPIPHVPAITLGAVALSPVAVTEVYSMLAQQGVHRPLQTIQAVTSHDGALIYERPHPVGKRVFDDAGGFLINFGLRGVVNEGTGRALTESFGLNRLAGKSGTTNDYRDSWFVAYDHQHVTTVWLGRDDNKPIHLTGSRGALKVVQQMLTAMPLHPLQLSAPATIEAGGFHAELGTRIPTHCEHARLFPAVYKKLPENLSCSGNIEEEKSWWQRLF